MYPSRLLALLIALTLFVAFVIWNRRKSSTRAIEQNRTHTWKRHVAVTAAIAAITFLSVALARPVWYAQAPKERMTVMIVMDVSGSMKEKDIEPSRIEAAQQAAKYFITSLPGSINVSLISFATTAKMLVPPTTEKEQILTAIDNLKALGSTYTAEGIQTALNAVDLIPDDPEHPGDRGQTVIVLLADGESSNSQKMYEAAETAKQMQIPIFAIAYGPERGYEELLKIATISGGQVYSADSFEKLNEVYADIAKLTVYERQKKELALLFVCIGILSGIIAALAAARIFRSSAIALMLAVSVGAGAQLSPFSGEGTSDNPYKISNATQLKQLADLVNAGTAPYANPGICYEQTADIDLSGVAYTPIGTSPENAYPEPCVTSFSGNYNGAHFTISNLIIERMDEDFKAMFGWLETNAVVKNVRLINAVIYGSGWVGGVAGQNDGTIQNCYVNAIQIAGIGIVGGVAGRNDGTIQHCMVTGEAVKGKGSIGGMAGWNGGTIANGYTTIHVKSFDRDFESYDNTFGGIAGYNDGSVNFCYATGNITGAVTSAAGGAFPAGAGGIVGFNAGGEIQNCVALNKTVALTNIQQGGVGRVTGAADSRNSNNYARSNMVLQNSSGNVAPTAGLTTKDGESITSINYYASRWWVSIGFSGEHWSFAINRLLHLTDFPNLKQDPTIRP